mmetsp:Transcript_11216/g.28362  ORF Transcript_11216/g.28362 Transcript_11216/m.28362 type:complete len:105 (-) Transcript_11216:555-869(-)
MRVGKDGKFTIRAKKSERESNLQSSEVLQQAKPSEERERAWTADETSVPEQRAEEKTAKQEDPRPAHHDCTCIYIASSDSEAAARNKTAAPESLEATEDDEATS